MIHTLDKNKHNLENLDIKVFTKIENTLTNTFVTSDLNYKWDKDNKNILSNINLLCNLNSTLIIVGDSFNCKRDIINFYDNIICKELIYICGDKDNFLNHHRENEYFLGVTDLIYFNCENFKFGCCHYPMIDWKNKQKDVPLLHGHSIKHNVTQTLDISWITSKYYMGENTVLSLAKAKSILKIKK